MPDAEAAISKASQLLDEGRKAQIEAEEIFRSEVRDSLSKPSTRLAKFWLLLNSGVGLLVISSVLVAGASKKFLDLSDTRQKLHEQVRSTKLVVAEIENRLRYVEHAQGPHMSRDYLISLKFAVDGMNGIPTDFANARQYSPLFHEFKEDSLYSLVWRLSAASPKECSVGAEAVLSRVGTLADASKDNNSYILKVDPAVQSIYETQPLTTRPDLITSFKENLTALRDMLQSCKALRG